MSSSDWAPLQAGVAGPGASWLPIGPGGDDLNWVPLGLLGLPVLFLIDKFADSRSDSDGFQRSADQGASVATMTGLSNFRRVFALRSSGRTVVLGGLGLLADNTLLTSKPLAYSADQGVTWTVMNAPLVDVQAIDTDGSLWIAGGDPFGVSPYYNVVTALSPAGPWTPVANGLNGAETVSGITWTGSCWIAFTSDSPVKVTTSLDGVTWTAAAAPPKGSGITDTQAYAHTVVDGTFYLWQRENTSPASVWLLTTTDGITWTRAVCTGSLAGPATSDDHGWSVSPALPVDLIGGSTYTVTSPSGTPSADYVKLEAFAGPVTNVVGTTVDDTGFVAVDGYRIFPGGVSSVDFFPSPTVSGITHWVLAGAPSGFAQVLAIMAAVSVASPMIELGQVTYGGGLFIGACTYDDGARTVVTSTDGITWTPQVSGIGSVYSTGYDGTYYYAGGVASGSPAHAAARSLDGVTWTPIAVPQDASSGQRIDLIATQLRKADIV